MNLEVFFIYSGFWILVQCYHLTLLLMSADEPKFLILMKSNSSVFFSFVPSDFCVQFRNYYIPQVHKRIFLFLFYKLYYLHFTDGL